MGRSIKGLRIAGRIVLVLAGYLYANIAVDSVRLRFIKLGMTGFTFDTISFSDYLKNGILFWPLILLLAALVLSFFKRMPLQMSSLGMTAVAGVCYQIIPPENMHLAMVWHYLSFPSLFPFNLIFQEHPINLVPYIKPLSWWVPVHQLLYLLGLALFTLAAVLTLVQYRKRRKAQPVEQREGADQF